jgi:hypothetical protein
MKRSSSLFTGLRRMFQVPPIVKRETDSFRYPHFRAVTGTIRQNVSAGYADCGDERNAVSA